ncbi:unnamed protein product [Pleuronectes platessa]|uniref:Uncharacterized protein n=1 Tax=Pleuronectes platessa TaxID=8262 RepID=A0A9N7Y4C4_PLEPL|nr:unnamed protein product [Pleuronectes platessa]
MLDAILAVQQKGRDDQCLFKLVKMAAEERGHIVCADGDYLSVLRETRHTAFDSGHYPVEIHMLHQIYTHTSTASWLLDMLRVLVSESGE